MGNCDPCSQGSGESSDKYLMVRATGVDASPCGVPSSASSSVSGCPKQEPTYDSITSSFVVPEVGSSITISVCNVGVYVTGMFVHFPGYSLTMQIIAISTENKQITLRNACADGVNPVADNPEAGQGVTYGSAFIPAPAPRCSSAESNQADLDNLLSPATELCVPQLDQTSLTAEVQLTGRTEADPANSAFKKCIRRVQGLFFKSGSIRQPNIESVAQADYDAYKPAGIEASTKQMRLLPRIMDFTGLKPNSKYILCGTTGTTKPVGPAFVFSPITKAFAEVGTITDHPSYTNLASGADFSQNYSVNITEITDDLLNKNLQNFYYLELKLIVGMQAASGADHRFLTVKLNDETIGVLAGTAGGIHTYQTFRHKVKVLQADTTFNFKLTADGNGIAYYFKLDAVGVYI